MTAVFGVSLLVGGLLLWQQGKLGDAWETLRDADRRALVAGAVLYLVGLAVLCLRWYLLVIVIHGKSNMARASEAFLTSVVINYALPIGLAVPTRAALTKRALGLTITETSAVAIWEIGADVIVLGTGTALWIALGGYQSDALAGRWALVALVLAALAVSAIAAALAVRRVRPALASRAVAKLNEVIRLPARDPRTAAITLGVTALYWGMQAAVLALLLDAVDVHPTPILVLGLTTMPILVGMLSPVPGGAGVREVLMTGVASLHGAATAPTLVAAVVYRVALFASIPILFVIVQLWLRAARKAGAETTLPAGRRT